MRTNSTAPAYEVVERTQHWTLHRGVAYRDCLVRLPDGRLDWLGIRDDLLGDAL